MVEFRNVSKSFWTGTQCKVILDQANFKIELGRSMGILALNGTGKTTIINMMAVLRNGRLYMIDTLDEAKEMYNYDAT
jgi:capsular polysaccharide transport system ATP-binding protein